MSDESRRSARKPRKSCRKLCGQTPSERSEEKATIDAYGGTKNEEKKTVRYRSDEPLSADLDVLQLVDDGGGGSSPCWAAPGGRRRPQSASRRPGAVLPTLHKPRTPPTERCLSIRSAASAIVRTTFHSPDLRIVRQAPSTERRDAPTNRWL
ncbi:hypothetical protein Q1695_015392 [Nippostrongylus brasiliensis]|nr:hypothetical protein Q1695_015392 [Nippostrongylus brasiliensis]